MTGKLWIIDTSSVTEIRRLVPQQRQTAVYKALSDLVDQDVLVYPAQVLDELERYTGSNDNKPDLPYVWTKRNVKHASRFGTDYENLKIVLAHPQAKRVLDTQKTGRDEADPYILELGSRLKASGYEVTVLTEDRRDKPMKLSLHTACSLLRLYPLTVSAFLEEQAIWP